MGLEEIALDTTHFVHAAGTTTGTIEFEEEPDKSKY